MVKENCTGERLAKIETTLDNVQQRQKEIDETNKSEHQEIKSMIKDFIDSADEKYANKTVEKLVYGLVAIVLTIIVSALIYVVIVK